MKGLATVEVGVRTTVKRFSMVDDDSKEYFEREVEFLTKAADSGIAPAVIAVNGDFISMQTCKPFDIEHLDVGIEDKILSQIRKLHSIGIAHRDIHEKNIVMHNGMPLFIDFEFATSCNPSLPSYDLYGPVVSKIRPPLVHQQIGISVWWDSTSSKANTLGKMFGPLKDVVKNE